MRSIPGQDSAAHVPGVREARVAQHLNRLGSTPTRLAVHHHVRARVDLGELRRKRAQGNQLSTQLADVELALLAHVDELEVGAFLAQLRQVLDLDVPVALLERSHRRPAARVAAPASPPARPRALPRRWPTACAGPRHRRARTHSPPRRASPTRAPRRCTTPRTARRCWEWTSDPGTESPARRSRIATPPLRRPRWPGMKITALRSRSCTTSASGRSPKRLRVTSRPAWPPPQSMA